MTLCASNPLSTRTTPPPRSCAATACACTIAGEDAKPMSATSPSGGHQPMNHHGRRRRSGLAALHTKFPGEKLEGVISGTGNHHRCGAPYSHGEGQRCATRYSTSATLTPSTASTTTTARASPWTASCAPRTTSVRPHHGSVRLPEVPGQSGPARRAWAWTSSSARSTPEGP